MSEVTDLVLPILQRLQADVAEIKRVQAEHSAKHDDHTRRLEDIEIYTAYETGLGTQNKADLQAIRKTIKDMEQRLRALEGTR